MQKGSLESEVHEQKEKEVQLKQSEERYRSLLESTMESAFKDLERQKKSLEKEVEEKTATQKVLRQTTRRLRMLNSIERKIVDEESLSSIVTHAVRELQELLDADRISVLQLDHEAGMVSINAEIGKSIEAQDEQGLVPVEWYRPFKKGLFVARNLSRMSERFPIEEMALEHGIQSYCRVTLTAGEAVAGALHVAHADTARFDEEYLKVVRDVADLLSIALRQHVHGIERKKYHEELIAERDRAEEMARLKTAFLTNMTHEIRTPLSGIIGFAQVLHEELDDERQEFAGHIQTAGKRLMTTINSVLDLSRLQADKASLHMAPLNASNVVIDTLKVLNPLAQNKELDLRVDVPEGIIATLDEKALETVVNNLVGNAFKFTEKGFVGVRLSPEGADLALSVSDSGIGISPDFIPMLFDEFRQEHMGADRPAEGSGLGLAITARIVEKMNGRIEVESEQGSGSTFTVIFEGALPRETEENADPTSRPMTTLPTNASGSALPVEGRTDAVA
jgi:signal transduction histidine kinase